MDVVLVVIVLRDGEGLRVHGFRVVNGLLAHRLRVHGHRLVNGLLVHRLRLMHDHVVVWVAVVGNEGTAELVDRIDAGQLDLVWVDGLDGNNERLAIHLDHCLVRADSRGSKLSVRSGRSGHVAANNVEVNVVG